MPFTLEVLPARKGDCLLLHYGTKQAPKLMMIDGGPSGVYLPHLKPRLGEIRKARKLGDNDSLLVDVVMISHVDDDHIKGILELTNELRIQKTQNQAQSLKARTLWHNSFDDVLKTTPKELEDTGFGPASAALAIETTTDPEALQTNQVLASIPQGRTLRDDAAALRTGSQMWAVNDLSKGGLILAEAKKGGVKIDGGLEVTVVGPLQAELKALQKAHDAYLKNKQKGGAEATALLAAYVDKSVANLSSIVMLVESGGKTVLLTGDARGDKILDGLRAKKLLGPKATDRLHVDVLKVPHHGSANNLETAFFRKVTADHYVFSGNGEHGNPEREAIEMLSAARPKAPFTMYFTYPIAEIDTARQADWKKEQAKEKKKGKKTRPNWNKARHSLASFLAKVDSSKQTIVTLSGDGDSHVIDLGTPITF